jgi:hypothetical protein
MAATQFPVEAGHIMMFARAIGDQNPVYSDPAQANQSEAGGVIAPPTFVQASVQYDPDYPLRPHPGQPWFGSGRRPTGRPAGGDEEGNGLHAEQHFEYLRSIRPGDVLTLSVRPGRSWGKEGRRGGTLRFVETVTEYRGADGELAVVTRDVVVLTARPVGEA